MDAHRRFRVLPADATVLVVVEPDLDHADEEVEAVRAAWGGRVAVVRGGQASVERVLAAMGDVDVVHVAAHGTYRGDNPLLSAIRLDDGPLTGYELAHARKQTDLVVLSWRDTVMIDSNASSRIGSHLLTSSGVTSTIASVSPVADFSSASITSRLHGELARGIRPSQALTTARQAVGGLAGCPSSAGSSASDTDDAGLDGEVGHGGRSQRPRRACCSNVSAKPVQTTESSVHAWPARCPEPVRSTDNPRTTASR